MFGPPQLLPNPDAVGDIIRIHRLLVRLSYVTLLDELTNLLLY